MRDMQKIPLQRLLVLSVKGDTRVPQLLIEHGAKVNVRDKWGNTLTYCSKSRTIRACRIARMVILLNQRRKVMTKIPPMLLLIMVTSTLLKL